MKVYHWLNRPEGAAETLSVALKCLFLLVWPDIFYCRSECWWVGGSRSRDMHERQVWKFLCSWLWLTWKSESDLTESPQSHSVNLQRTSMAAVLSVAPPGQRYHWPHDLCLKLPLRHGAQLLCLGQGGIFINITHLWRPSGESLFACVCVCLWC